MRGVRLYGIVLLAILVLAAPGCRRRAADPASQGPWDLITQTNLHPDARRHHMSSVNYQLDGFIPVCTPVRVSDVNRARAIVTDLRTMQETVQQHLDMYFAPSCPTQTLDSLGETDQQGIEQGQALPGMTKQGVVFAIGYPPFHRTASLEEDVWTYWNSRFGTFQVHFENGVVTQVQ